MEENPSTTRPVIVLVSVPDRRRNLDNDRGKFVMKNPFARHVDDNDIGPPKIDYVKNIHTGLTRLRFASVLGRSVLTRSIRHGPFIVFYLYRYSDIRVL